jgi:hypothetical protein
MVSVPINYSCFDIGLLSWQALTEQVASMAASDAVASL